MRWAAYVARVVGCWLLLALAAAPAAAQGDRIDFDRLSLEDGLSQSIIEEIVQDRQGFMWFATEDGLNRFDGYRFTVFRNEPGDAGSLAYNELKAVHEDRNGLFWVGIFETGLDSFDPVTQRVVHFHHDHSDPTSLIHNTVREIFEDSAGRLWVGTEGGLDRLDRGTNVFHHYPLADEAGANDIRALTEARDGKLWVGTNGGGLFLLDPESGDSRRFAHDPSDPGSLSHNRVHAILVDHTGTVWVGTYGGGLDAFVAAGGRFIHHRANPDNPDSLSNDLINALVEDHEGTLWIGTDGGGLNRYNSSLGTFESFRHNPIDPYSLSTDRIYSLYQDRSRVLWVGTYGGGLSKFDVSRKGFRRFQNDPGRENSLSHNIVWAFAEDRGDVLWIGTDSGGLNRFDRETGQWRHFRHDPNDPSSLSHDTVRSVLIASDGHLWVGTNGGGVNRLDRENETFVRLRHDPDDPNSLSHDELRSIFEDSSGRLWFGTFGGGVDRYDPVSGEFTNYRNDPTDPSSLSNDYIRLVFEDNDGAFWVGTQGGGLNRLDPQTGTATRFRHDPEDPASISSDHVFAIVEGADGTMWLGNFGGGLDRFDRAAGTATRYGVEHGLATNSVYAVLEDLDGKLWLSTTRGLSQFDPEIETFRNFDVRDGLQSNEFNGGSAFIGGRGEMYFGGIAGFNAFFPAAIGINTEAPTVAITDLQLFNRSVAVGEEINGRVVLDRPITSTEAIELSHEENFFTLEFAALHYSTPGKNQYRYRMLGFSDEWIRVAADRRYATFTNLAPGGYTFSVRGANSDGVWSEQQAELQIVITPPFWATWWFRLAAGFALVAMAAAVVAARVRNVRLKTALDTAHDAQMAIMPQSTPEVPGFDIAGQCLPAHEVGGDFYDYFWLEGEPPRLCVVVGDVAGKAMPAAMNAVMSDGMVFSRARQGGSVEEMMRSLNRSVHLKVGKRVFTALCLMVLDPESRELTFANAGLCEPILKRADGAEALDSPGDRVPLGVLADAAHESRAIELEAGDVVVVFSDGIPEARDRSGDLYGYDAPRELLAGLDTSRLSAEKIKDALVDDVQSFSGSDRPSDDISIVVVKVG